jgi:hypothetical protein
MLPDTLGLVAGTLRVLSSFWSGAENAIFYKIRAIICVWELKLILRNSKGNAPCLRETERSLYGSFRNAKFNTKGRRRRGAAR